MLRFVGMFLQVRTEKHIAMKEARKKMLERQDTVAMISRFLKLKTYKALMIGI